MKTFDYDLFDFIPSNRTINKGLVARLKKSITEHGYVNSRPIIVNKEMLIIDGQHRYIACKELKLPIIYEIETLDEQKAMIALNMNQQIWRLNEYIDHWASFNIPCYVAVKDYEQTHKFGISSTLSILKGNVSKATANDIRLGKEFELNQNADSIAQFVHDCKPFINFAKTKVFISAVVSLFKQTTFENTEIVLSRIQIVRQQANVSDYMAVFENIINKRKRDKITLK